MFISNRNKRGVLAFVSFLIILVFVPRIIMNFIPEARFNLKDSEILLARKQFSQVQSNHGNWKNAQEGSKYRVPPSSFDPNQYTLNDWMYLGLSEKQAQVVLNFTKYGVHSNQELKRIFVIPEELYRLIKDSTTYSSRFTVSNQAFISNQIKKTKKLDINVATQEELELLNGIGPFFAKRILAFRNKLGGFYDVTQLREVYQFTEDQFQKIHLDIECDAEEVVRVNINQVTAKELAKHPYFNWNLANTLCKMRDQMGGFKTLEEIKKSHLVTNDVYERIKNYLKLN